VNLIPSQNTGVWRLITSILRMEFFTLLKLLGFIVLLANTLKILSKAIQTYTDRMMPKITKMQKYIYIILLYQYGIKSQKVPGKMCCLPRFLHE